MIPPILSLTPVDSLTYLGGFADELEVILFGLSPRALTLDMSLVIHSLGYPDDPVSALLTKEIMQAFEFTAELFPAFALQGIAVLTGLIVHTQSQATIRLGQTYFLEEPIYDVLPPSLVQPNYLWLPQTPEQITATKWAIASALEQSFDGFN